MSSETLYAGVDPAQFRGHPVDLEVFSGPLDMLLHLIQKDRIEIWEISISRITEQYLAHLRSLEALNLEIAGEFLVMAATLMRIKSQMLLPRPTLSGEDATGMPLTREGLIERLLEYRRYREAALSLRFMEEQQRRTAPRGWTPALAKDHLYPLRQARVVDLAAYLRDVLKRAQTPPQHEVQLEEVKLEEQMDYIAERVSASRSPIPFADLLRRPWLRLERIVTFLAMLELMRQRRIEVLQEEPLGEILVVKRESTADEDAGPVQEVEPPDAPQNP